jgi:hypothetical protein
MGLPSERHAHMSPRHICRRQRSPKCSTSRAAAAIAAIVAGRDASPAAVFSARKLTHAAAAMREAA